jgi:hypothetical protein
MPFQPIRRLAAAAALLLAASLPAHALTFDLKFLDGTSSAVAAGFQTAADAWSQLLSDPVTVSLTLGTSASLGTGILASTYAQFASFNYNDVYTALGLDRTSATDTTAYANLPVGNVPLLINYTADNPNGIGSATPYIDTNDSANNTTIRMTSANARALGLTANPGQNSSCIGTCDGYIVFSSTFSYDYDPSDGITSGAFDFIGLAEHEIGHALGFISGVDILDTNSPSNLGYYNADQFTNLSPLDLFRCSATTQADQALYPGLRDFTANTSAKFFSIDGCRTADLGGSFSTGVTHGDGRQASHWKDGQSLGLMDPTAAPGEKLAISPLDLQAFDAIGWNLTSVPEPASLLLLGSGLVGLVGVRRHGRFRRG